MIRRKTKGNFSLSAIALAVAGALHSAPALAQFVEGGPITNPLDGATETIQAFLDDPVFSVRTLEGNVIWIGPTTVNAQFSVTYRPPEYAADGVTILIPERRAATYRITAAPVAASGRIESITYQEVMAGPSPPPAPPPVTTATAYHVGTGTTGTTGIGPGSVTPPPASGVPNQWVDRQHGRYGDNGSDGWGVEICIISCWMIGDDADSGDPGSAGPTLDYAVNRGLIDMPAGVTGQHGVWVSSRGGDGGKGGNAYGIMDAAGGGAAGRGGTVNIIVNNDVITRGNTSYGVFVQSRAGAAGDGGSGYILAGSGSGGIAAEGGDATATNNNRIETWGIGSIGVYSQSLGGGGGNSGDSYGLVGNADDGSVGGNGGTATINNHGVVVTNGLVAHGLFAQSMGGSGGDAGATGGLAGLGGNGATGGDGRRAAVTNDGTVVTFGSWSHGIVGQSIGGGGGNGSNSGGIAGIGGSGSGGGNGGAVYINNDWVNATRFGQIETWGTGSFGILAESVGGGGGSGGSGAGLAGIGGTGTQGGQGGAVDVLNDGNVVTHGSYAHGILAHSIGGGGGAGGNGDGLVGIGGSSSGNPLMPSNGGRVWVDNETHGLIRTFGRDANGILAQSIGGGGGAGAGSGGLASLGGSGSGGGDGTHVRVRNDGLIITSGRDARGIVAQSIGGGGGSASNSGGAVEIGGSGGGGGNGGYVEIINRNTISTSGIGSDAIVAQSIGGGGGNGASSDGVVGIGGSGTGGGNGGEVDVTNTASIQTLGHRARGVVAESIGGGGGNGGDGGGLVSIGGAAGPGGAIGANPDVGARVDVINSGLIGTRGNQASAIEARSVGGGGGNGGSSGGAFLTIGGSGGAGGAGGEVHIDNDRSLSTEGNDSHGIYAQSVGGGGGNGGNAVSVSAFGGAAIGGTGGAASNGALVRISGGLDGAGNPLTTRPVIATEGDRAKGVFAQSVGGGGGNGGFAAQVTVGYALGASMGIGGNGGAAGNGGLVDVDGRQSILTSGADADGMLIQSIGGGGGNGGFAVTFAGAAGDVGSGALSAAIGGAGAAGGTGGQVDIDAGGSIATSGAMSEGIVAQSIGGGGGTGGFAIALSAAIAGGGAGSVSAAIGGNGGVGGNAGRVDLDYAGDIRTQGVDSVGVLSQAVGGGGGNGGYTISGAVSGAGGGAGAVAVGVAGTAGGGGTGGEVRSRLEGTLTTSGDRSSGLVVQSIGGRGGNGGFNVSGSIAGAGAGAGAVSIGVGGAGGGGGDGATAEGIVNGTAITEGRDADAVLVQSVGGGGGNGGFNVSGAIAGAGTGAGAVSVGIGGSGGNAGSGRLATATIDGSLSTHGDGSSGLIVQSVGGGGGNGGFNVSGAISAAGSGAGGVAVGLGGSGGGGGSGGVVTATVNAGTHTRGDDATGIVAQSLGGGGGSGGFNVSGAIAAAGSASGAVAVGLGGSGGGGGSSGQTTLTVTGDTLTEGNRSGAMLVQSVGGGGGNGGFDVTGSISGSGGTAGAVSVGIGGSGGGGGNAALVTGILRGNLETRGNESDGIVVQSIGGGGGNGGFSVAGSISGAGSAAGAVSVGLGGSGAGAGNGGRSIAIIEGNVTTRGDGSGGIVAQSVGGGGGNGGFVVAGSVSGSGQSALGVAVGLGGSGGGGGNGGIVNATITGNTVTEGRDATAVLVQSLGGGGGSGGMSVAGSVSAAASGAGAVSVGLGGSGGQGGDGEEVRANVAGLISTAGDGAAGFVAQSLGGGGGAGGINVSGAVAAGGSGTGAVAVGLGGSGGEGGDGRVVQATLDGSVRTEGDDSTAVLFQSVGGGGGSGGINISGAASLSKSGAGSLAFGLGGAGGEGGAGGDVSGIVDAIALTAGDRSVGVLLQSIGGGGGSGGMNVAGSVSVTKNGGVGAALGVGGFGGGAGDGRDVTLDRTGMTVTRGANADGVVAQSIGGAGGNGGMNVSGALAISTSGSAVSASLGVGGFGGDGGNAGAVELNVAGDVIAEGYAHAAAALEDGMVRETIAGGSHGVFAQSLGGAGGNGGVNISGGIAYDNSSAGNSHSLTLGIGGFGGGGGNAGDVAVSVMASQVAAIGDSRVGVAAQSVGGGGGTGAINIAGGIAMDGVLTVGIGGSGGSGGTSGDVNASALTDIRAAGERAVGFLAQSLGGRGGNGAINISGGFQASGNDDTPTLVFGVGGTGGAGNISGDVDATQRGDIVVGGNGSKGIFAQSVAGGGGSGGLNVSGNVARGGGYNAVIGIGGTAGDGADAGNVFLRSDGMIVADGRGVLDETFDPDYDPGALETASMAFTERANGILAQSVGGGGGEGGINASGVVATEGNAIAIGVGGRGGGGGNAGAVTLHRGLNTASILETRGNNANGITAQSVGGGGGMAGMNFLFSLTTAAPEGTPARRAVNIGVGGNGGDPGHGDEVEVRHAGDIRTSGNHSHGLMAQSVGGGGGSATFNMGLGRNPDAKTFNMALGGAPGEGGTGDRVSVEHSGDIATVGNVSSAIFAQSVGGGGGSTGLDMVTSPWAASGIDVGLGREGGNGGAAGEVSVRASGQLTTQGDRSVGIRAQSVGNGGGESSSISGEISGEGGGRGQDWSSSVEVGLEGGLGGEAGNVEVISSGAIYTRGISAHGIRAQSVGGGGGDGGAIERHGIMEANNQMSIGVGGTGGQGGNAGEVLVNNSAEVQTQGYEAHGVSAQSIGGAGGSGGAVVALDLETSLLTDPGSGSGGGNTFGLQVGGSGGTGSLGNLVDVTNTGDILTTGRRSVGIDAQSTGGGGGQGGAAFSMGVSRGDNSRNVAITVGGSGDRGGDAGAVDVLNEGRISTQGDEAIGIRAMSQGGTGGDAGVLLELGVIAIGNNQSARNLSIKVGGEGGIGGVGGDVHVINRESAHPDALASGVIHTQGQGSHAIFAQSLGGGGGNGSSVVTSNIGASAGGQANLVNLSVGGRGGNGGAAGDVTVDNESLIDTEGAGAHGVFAQSVGGGGGNGGLVMAANAVLSSDHSVNAKMITVGGAGGRGDDAGDVIVNNSGRIITRGERSHGIFAQSIGGGGGNAGVGFGLSTNPSSMVIAGALASTFGGNGGAGGRGGSVTVNHSGDITVLGRNSQAVVAESINGGGGHVQLDFNGVTSLPGLPDSLYEGIPLPQGTQTPTLIEFSGGGEDVSDSNAGQVTLNYTGTFGVAGANGAANVVQAIGGGGGTYDLTLALDDFAGAADDVAIQGRLGGVNGANNRGGDVASSHEGDLITEGDNTPGALVQSIGGGGGRANLMLTSANDSIGATSLTIGGQGGGNEQGGDISHVQNGAVTTLGDSAHGGVFQSIGGGGGSLSLIAEGGESVMNRTVVRKASTSSRALLQPQLSFGSNGGAGLSGGDVTLTLEGDVYTQGGGALGLVFQSIGGGGGMASVRGVDGLSVNLGGSNGASGNGGDLTVVNTGDVLTAGSRAHGVFLQSLGGGGSALFTDSVNTLVALSSANSGSGGDIDFRQVGSIETQGDDAYSLFAQSVGGGGGFIDGAFAASAGGTGTAGTIDLELDGDLLAFGARSTALFAQSTGANGLGGNITATLTQDNQIIGGDDGVAVYFEGGATNRFTNRGFVRTLSGPRGYAFRGGAGGDFVDNDGMVMGNVDLGGGANGFANNLDGRFYTGTTVNLGDPSNVLRNEGLIAPGSAGLAVQTHLNGSFVQTGLGALSMEIDFTSGIGDRLTASGAVSVAGALELSLLNVHDIRSGQHFQPLFTGGGGAVNAGIDFSPQRSVVIDYQLINQNPNALGVQYTVDFSAEGLQGNRVQMGDYLNRVQRDGGPAALDDTVTAAVMHTDLAAYANMLTQLGAEFYTEQQAMALSGTQRFARNLQNCGTTSLGEAAGDDTGCYWIRYDDNPSVREARAGFPSARDSSYSISQGVQVPGDTGWTWGFGFDFEDHRTQGFDGLWSSGSKLFQLGANARRDLGFANIGATLALGNNSQDVRRQLFVTDASEARGDRRVTFLTHVLDLSRDFGFGGGRFTLQPSMNLGTSMLRYGTMFEEGAGAQNAVILRGNETHLWMEPAVSGRYVAEFGNGASLRLFARLGLLRYLSGTSTKVRSGLEGAGLEMAAMRTGSDLGRQHLVGEAGLQLSLPGGFTTTFSYNRRESDLREGGAGGVRFVLPLQ